MKKCPLCATTLKAGGPNNEVVFCPILVECKNKMVYHYRFLPSEYICVPPYKVSAVVDFTEDDKGEFSQTLVWQLDILKDDSNIIKWNYITDIPIFPVTSEEQLIKKLKTIVLFS